jgi:protein-S-isoprenylcysteine O-methyltransferase Ste14
MKLGKFLYTYRSLTPIPLIIVLLILAKPLLLSLIIGCFVSILGELLRLTSVAYTGLTTRSKNVQSGGLVTNGPYGILRNPIYAGNFFLSLGVVVAAHALFPWFIPIYVVVFALQYVFIIRYEEKFLEKSFKDEYRDYRAHVPSFFPTFNPYRNGSALKPDFKIACRSEKNTINISLIIYGILIAIFLIQRFIGWWR